MPYHLQDEAHILHLGNQGSPSFGSKLTLKFFFIYESSTGTAVYLNYSLHIPWEFLPLYLSLFQLLPPCTHHLSRLTPTSPLDFSFDVLTFRMPFLGALEKVRYPFPSSVLPQNTVLTHCILIVCLLYECVNFMMAGILFINSTNIYWTVLCARPCIPHT